jgi:hypothetical protein
VEAYEYHEAHFSEILTEFGIDMLESPGLTDVHGAFKVVLRAQIHSQILKST